MLKTRSGFTLIELLIVVIIVSILAAVALPRFRQMTRRARATEASAAVGAILTAELVYYEENGFFLTLTSVPNNYLLVDVTNAIDFQYWLTLDSAPGGPYVLVTATGSSPKTSGIVVSGKMNTTGERTKQTVTGI